MWGLDYKESWVLKNWCFWTVVLEKTLESPLDCKEIQAINPKGNQPWIFIGRTDDEAETLNTLATWCEELTHLKRIWCWEKLKAGGEGLDGITDAMDMSLSSESWWWTGWPGVLQSMGSQRVGHDWATELNWAIRGRERQLKNKPASPHEHRVVDVPLWAIPFSLCISTEDQGLWHRTQMEKDHKSQYFLWGRHKIFSSYPESSIQTGRKTSLSWMAESEAGSRRWKSVLDRLE